MNKESWRAYTQTTEFMGIAGIVAGILVWAVARYCFGIDLFNGRVI